ncbi:MAG: ABC transporter permease [Patescibacteria group bacterium]|nr:ABC transporter permease [Patescibacteria group bacterium]
MFYSVSFLRVIKTGFVNFVRNLWLSAAATMVMTITLVILATLFLLFAVTNFSLKSIQNTVDISVYFKIGLAEEKISALQQQIQSNPKVKEVKYTSAEEAFKNFKERHSDDLLITQSLNELTENPLPATINIKAYNLEDYPGIASQLQDAKYQEVVDKINFEDNRVIIERLNKILKFIVSFGIGLVAVFSLIAILVIFNTITLTIYNRREEVEIMRLVGATNWYIRGPFLTESFLYAISATVLCALIFLPVFIKILPKVAAYVNPQMTFFNQNIFNFWYLVLILFVVSLILAMSSTLLAIRKYLKI